MKFSKISWTNHTFNPWIGCAKVSAGCAHCYAEEQQATRFNRVQWGVYGTRIRTSTEYWKQPLTWNRSAGAEGTKYRVFCASLADVFEPREDLESWRDELLDLIRHTPNLQWLLLTKRPQSAAQYFSSRPAPENIWLGTSVEDRPNAQIRIPALRSINAPVRFLSMEPLLADPGELNLDGIDWVIVGGESGPHYRTMDKKWALSVRDQCASAGVPFFFKQWSGIAPAKLGHQLDGVVHHNFPR